METLRYDRGQIKQKHFTDEGFLVVDAVFTRTGVFSYRNNDGSERLELRHPEDVLKDDSLKSMSLLPITLLHPKERVVDSENARKVSIGTTGESVNHDGNEIFGTVKITDKAAIEKIENDNITELSLGYRVKLVDDEGEFKGQRHDVRQTEIKYNHLAVVQQGRAGVAKLVLDAVDAVQTEKEDHKPIKKEKNIMTMVNHNVDGINYEAAPQIVNHLIKETGRADTAETALVELNTAHSTMKADNDSLKEKLTAAEKIDHSEAIQEKVDSRISLVGSAMLHLNTDEAKDLNIKTDSEIQLLVIKKYSPDFNKDGVNADSVKDPIYMKARFDAALENKPEEKNNDHKSTIGDQRKTMGVHKTDDKSEINADKSRNDYAKSLTNAWKPEPATA